MYMDVIVIAIVHVCACVWRVCSLLILRSHAHCSLSKLKNREINGNSSKVHVKDCSISRPVMYTDQTMGDLDGLNILVPL